MNTETKSNLFKNISQTPIDIRGVGGRSPMFIRSGSMLGAMFLAPIKPLRAMLPNALFAPYEVFKGHGIIAIHCMEYKDTDIGPYNEVALAIATHYSSPQKPGLIRAAAGSLFRTWHAFIVDLPVSTQIAVHGGVDFFNYPKYLADITFRETARQRICTVRCPDTMDLIIEFEGRKISSPLSAVKNVLPNRITDMSFFTYPVIDGVVKRARTHIRPLKECSTFLMPDAAVHVGHSPRAAAYQKARPGKLLQYQYVPEFEAVLYAPEALDDFA
jgi:hypothetical protein